jgi:zinc protease
MILADSVPVHATQVTVLPNGLTVLVHEDQRFPLVSIRLFVRAGSAHEDPEQAGISHMLEHMVFKGTTTRTPGEVAAQIEGVGGELNAATGFDATMYIMDVPDEHWVLALEVLQDMIFQAAIDPDELESERQVILSELDQGQDQPQRRLFEAVQKTLWAETPYGRPIIGFRETVQSISREHMLEFIQSRYQPSAMLLVVCGNVRQGEVLEQAERLFGDLANQAVIEAPPALYAPFSANIPQLVVEQGPWRKAHFALALPIPGLNSIQSAGMDVLAQMLGGDRTSLLYRTFKHEQGIVDAISASATSLERAGMLYIQAQMDPENVPRLWEGLITLLADLNADSFALESLERAKLNLEDSLFQAKETIAGLASKLGYFQFHEQSLAAEQRYLYLIRHMNTAQLEALIAEHIRPEGLVAALFTPEPEALDSASMTAWLDARWPGRDASASGLRTETLDAPGREIIRLAPDRILVLLPDPFLPYTALNFTWSGGDVLLTPEEQGLSELTARVWTKGTLQKNAPAIQDFLADRAARVAAGAGLEKFSLNASYPSRFEPDMLPFLLELIQEPSWAPEELERAKKEQAAAIVRAEDHPVGLAFRRIFPFLFPGHPYGYLRSGEPETLQTFTRDNVAAFWERQKNKPWVLSVSGDFNRQAIINMAKGIAAVDPSPAVAPAIPVWSPDREEDLHLADRNQAHILVVFPVPGLAHKDTAGLRVLREVLAGQSGLLFQDLRDKQGLAYAVSAFLWQDSLTGFLAFYIATSPDLVDEALAGFQAAAQRLSRSPLSEAELDRAKNLLWGDYHRDRQPLMARAQEVSEALARGLDPDHEIHLLEQARLVTSDDLSALVESYLQWEEAYLLKVLP